MFDPGRLASRSGYLLLAGAVALGFLSTDVLIQRHVALVDGQYLYWETYPLGGVVFGLGLLLTAVAAAAGSGVLVSVSVRRGPRPAETAVDHRRWAGSLALVVASLAMLQVGHFVQFDDTSGFGSDRWMMWLGVLAALTAIASLPVALPSAFARRVLAGTDLLVVALTLWGARADDGFRFVWAGDEGELVAFQIVVAAISTLLLVSTLRRPPARELEPRSLLDTVLASRVRFAIVVALVVGYAATVLVLRGSGSTLFVGIHALVASVVLTLWAVAGRAVTRRGRALLGMVAGALALAWVAVGAFGGLLVATCNANGCFLA